jgi:hypothetical protein
MSLHVLRRLSRKSYSPSRALMAAIAMALTVGAGSAAAKRLEPVDALLSAQTLGHSNGLNQKSEAHFARGKLSTFHGHYNERLGLPSLITVSEKTPNSLAPCRWPAIHRAWRAAI